MELAAALHACALTERPAMHSSMEVAAPGTKVAVEGTLAEEERVPAWGEVEAAGRTTQVEVEAAGSTTQVEVEAADDTIPTQDRRLDENDTPVGKAVADFAVEVEVAGAVVFEVAVEVGHSTALQVEA